MRMLLGAVTAAALALSAGIALADVEEMSGKIQNIDATTKMVTVGDKTLQWSENSTGTKLDELKEGDEVKVRFQANPDGHNDIMEIMKE